MNTHEQICSHCCAASSYERMDGDFYVAEVRKSPCTLKIQVKGMVFVMEMVIASVCNHSLLMIALFVIALTNVVAMVGVALNFQ